jgi:hypothetical protein
VSFNVPLRCRCGHVRGMARSVSPSEGFRFVCYCKDCRAFARFLDRPDVLDAAGGTDIFQMPPGRVTLDAGADALRCVRLSDGTPVFRWYADCCRTPIANTAGPRFPVIGLVHSFMGNGADSRSRDETLGAQLCRIYEGSAVAPLPQNAPPPASLQFLLRRASKAFAWWMRGLAHPNPFFDASTNAPRAEPRVLTPQECAAL